MVFIPTEGSLEHWPYQQNNATLNYDAEKSMRTYLVRIACGATMYAMINMCTSPLAYAIFIIIILHSDTIHVHCDVSTILITIRICMLLLINMCTRRNDLVYWASTLFPIFVAWHGHVAPCVAHELSSTSRREVHACGPPSSLWHNQSTQ